MKYATGLLRRSGLQFQKQIIKWGLYLMSIVQHGEIRVTITLKRYVIK